MTGLSTFKSFSSCHHFCFKYNPSCCYIYHLYISFVDATVCLYVYVCVCVCVFLSMLFFVKYFHFNVYLKHFFRSVFFVNKFYSFYLFIFFLRFFFVVFLLLSYLLDTNMSMKICFKIFYFKTSAVNETVAKGN